MTGKIAGGCSIPSSAGVPAGIRRPVIEPHPQINRGTQSFVGGRVHHAPGLPLGSNSRSAKTSTKGEQKSNRDTVRLKTPPTPTKQTKAPNSNRDKQGVSEIVGGRVHHAPGLAVGFDPRSPKPTMKGEQKSNRDTVQLKTPATPTKQRKAPNSNRDKQGVSEKEKNPARETKHNPESALLFRAESRSSDWRREEEPQNRIRGRTSGGNECPPLRRRRRGKTQCHTGRVVNPRPYGNRRYDSLVTTSFTVATMSRCSLMGTWYSPISLIGSVSWILRLSML
jgi:hypothetical protein